MFWYIFKRAFKLSKVETVLVSLIIIKGGKLFFFLFFYYVTSNYEISINNYKNKKKKYNKGNVLITYFIMKNMDTLPIFH